MRRGYALPARPTTRGGNKYAAAASVCALAAMRAERQRHAGDHHQHSGEFERGGILAEKQRAGERGDDRDQGEEQRGTNRPEQRHDAHVEERRDDADERTLIDRLERNGGDRGVEQPHRNQQSPDRRAQERQDRDAGGGGDRAHVPAAGQQAEIGPHHRGEHEQEIAAPGALARRRADQGIPREHRNAGEDQPDAGELGQVGPLAQHQEAEQHRHDRNEPRRDDGVVERRRERGPADEDERVGRAREKSQHQRAAPAELAHDDGPLTQRHRQQHQARDGEAQDRDVGGAQPVDHRPARDDRLHAPDQRAKDAEADPLPERRNLTNPRSWHHKPPISVQIDRKGIFGTVTNQEHCFAAFPVPRPGPEKPLPFCSNFRRSRFIFRSRGAMRYWPVLMASGRFCNEGGRM